MVNQIKVSGLQSFNRFTLNFEKNTNKYIGTTMFDLAKLTRDIAKRNFSSKHTRYSKGRSVRTIRAVKLNNRQSQVRTNLVVGLQEIGTNPHVEPNNPVWHDPRRPHPGFKAVPVLRPASQEALRQLKNISNKNFRKFILIK